MCMRIEYFKNEDEFKRMRDIIVQLQKRRDAKLRKSCTMPEVNLVEEFDEAFPAKQEVMHAVFGWAIVDNDTGEVVNSNIEHHYSFNDQHASDYLIKEMKRLTALGTSCRIERISIHQRSVIDNFISMEAMYNKHMENCKCPR
jgi:hypothetical protein